MANYINSYLAALLNDGHHQILPVSKAQLIELASSQKGKFGDNVVDVAGALTYLLGQDATNLAAAKSYTGTSINNLAGSYTVPTGMVVTEIKTAHGEISGGTVSAYLNAGDIKRTATVEDAEAGTKKIDATDVEGALQELANAIEVGGTGSVVTLEQAQTPDAGYLKTYIIKQGGNAVGGSIAGKINIPKDFLVKSGQVKTATADDESSSLYPDVKAGEKYLDFVVNVKEGSNATDEHIYIPVKDLTDIYTGITWNNGTYGTSASVNGSNEISVELNGATLTALAKAETAIQDKDLAVIAKSGKAVDATVNAGTELSALAGTGEGALDVSNVDAALNAIAGKVNALNNADYVRSVQGQAGVNDGVELTFVNTADQTGAAVLQLKHSLGNTAVLHYDSKATNDGISEEFFNAVIKA